WSWDGLYGAVGLAEDALFGATACAPGPFVAPARRTDGIVRTIDRIYHGGGKVGYLLYLDGARFQLDMERDELLLSPHFSPQYVLAAVGELAASVPRECVYRGTVDSSPESLAHDMRALQDRDAESALHVFTRESFSFEAAVDARDSCGTRDSHRGRRHAPGRKERRRKIRSAPGARRRRSVSRARHVELLLVADESMTKKYGKDLNHYLLTLATIASKLYGHASIENPIRLTVVKQITVTEKERGLDISKNAAATLKSFCKWQHQQNPLDDDHRQHHDAAILFTRQVNEHAHPLHQAGKRARASSSPGR
uniref:Peptidase M12B domain-containing protein n=1 Tax=Neogobius melanostomus TaxID=47308 RepID=A0A8C6UQL6_9GOBI